MGKRGPAPRATELRLLDGNPSRRPINDKEPKPEGEALMPKHLSKEAKACWKQVINSMPPGIYTEADSPLLAAFCEAWAGHVKATRALAKSSLVLGGKANPAIAIQNQMARTMAALGTRLGLSPSDRTNLKTPDNTGKSKWHGLTG